jgi:signal transduction histidine kinase
MTVESQELFFEVHCRINKSDLENEFEFLLIDITRIKVIEKTNTDYKYKSLFFSKVAHEFKNPLICVCELINQTYEILPEIVLENNEIISNLDQIRSLSNFLQILIKDFTHFSENQFGKITNYDQKETDLFSLINFCSSIGKALLIKSNKTENVEIKIKIDERVPQKITTDEWRLKQILINLLSNSVKFTLNGFILLYVSIENFSTEETTSKDSFKIKFLVKDTGIGIKENKCSDLSKPFKKGSTKLIKINNEFGSGLGLSIASEIASKLGGRLDFESKLGEGSSFWFQIPIPKDSIYEKSQLPQIIISSAQSTDNPVEMQVVENDGLSQNSLSTKELNDMILIRPKGNLITEGMVSSSEDNSVTIFENSKQFSRSHRKSGTKNSNISNVKIYFIIFIGS